MVSLGLGLWVWGRNMLRLQHVCSCSYLPVALPVAHVSDAGAMRGMSLQQVMATRGRNPCLAGCDRQQQGVQHQHQQPTSSTPAAHQQLTSSPLQP
jgi:hypothetical protein